MESVFCNEGSEITYPKVAMEKCEYNRISEAVRHSQPVTGVEYSHKYLFVFDRLDVVEKMWIKVEYNRE